MVVEEWKFHGDISLRVCGCVHHSFLTRVCFAFASASRVSSIFFWILVDFFYFLLHKIQPSIANIKNIKSRMARLYMPAWACIKPLKPFENIQSMKHNLKRLLFNITPATARIAEIAPIISIISAKLKLGWLPGQIRSARIQFTLPISTES